MTLRSVHIVLFLTLGVSGAFSEQTFAVDSSGEKKAWTVSWSEGPVSLTEVWIEAAQGPRRLGVFPGKSNGIEWNASGDGLLYRDRPLKIKLIGIPPVERRKSPLVLSRTWEIPIGSGAVRSVPHDGFNLSSAERESLDAAEGAGPPSQEIKAALQGLGAGFQAAALAYTALHQWDFDDASKKYRRAASTFAALPGEFPHIGLYREPVAAYVRALEDKAMEARKDGARWVCREHLQIIADLLDAYAMEHDLPRPEDLPALKIWAEARVSSKENASILNDLFRSSEDPESGREFSYLYRANAMPGEAVLTSYFYKGRLVELVHDPDGDRIQDRSIGRGQIDSLLADGVALLEAGNPHAPQALEMVTRVAPRFPLGHAKAGYAYLESRQMDKALASFERAIKLDHRLAEAHNGLGLVFQERPKARHDAIRYFQKALQYDRDYVEARFNIESTPKSRVYLLAKKN